MDSNLLALVEGRDGCGSFEQLARTADRQTLERFLTELETFRRATDNFYFRVRAVFFLGALHRYFLPPHYAGLESGTIPFEGHKHAQERRFEEAIDVFIEHQAQHGGSDALSSALAAAYTGLAFKTLANQVQKTVRKVRGNQWMFRCGHVLDYPLRLRPELLKVGPDGSHPVLHEQTAVRLDLSHAAWSDIFFLGMDYPDGARVLNLSVDLGVHGRDASPLPPVTGFLRVISEPVLRLTSVDLGATVDIAELDVVFDFARDHLGLLKAAVIASGLIPSGFEGSGQSLSGILQRLVGPGLGLELVSQVRDIPKGSRLAVSTNLLGCLISLCMRASGQIVSLVGALDEGERRTIAGRAILGEWLGGSGGGWQDSGGVWPGIKLICGEASVPGDTEFGTSKGRLLPRHTLLGPEVIGTETRKALQDSLVLVHGGMSQNVGPILEMVTEKYLLKLEKAWEARQESQAILRELVEALKQGDLVAVAKLTTRNFFGPLQTIIPWVSNAYTERLIEEISRTLGPVYRGFVMLGGMSGGGMGFWVDPAEKTRAQAVILEIMQRTKTALASALPFAMNPVVYDFSLNERGSWATLKEGEQALLTPEYYLLMVPRWLRQDPRQLSSERRQEMDRFSTQQLFSSRRTLPADLVERIFPPADKSGPNVGSLRETLAHLGFDTVQHERIREDLRSARIGLAQNRLPITATVEDVGPDEIGGYERVSSATLGLGKRALQEGRVAVVTLAAGAGSRWTQGAGTVKALHPFAKLSGKHRSFLETHLAKSRAAVRDYGVPLSHVFTTSHLTDEATRTFLKDHGNFDYPGYLALSPGRSIGLRLVPTVRDLTFAFEEMPRQRLDPQKEKMRHSLDKAYIDWARTVGEGSDYTDNLPSQCLHPVGHWYEIANLLLNGTLAAVIEKQPQVEHLLLHNIDTLGASLDPAVLGYHLESKSDLTVEVIHRRIEDRGGGLARINGQLRLVEGMALAREEDEFKLHFYNTATYWLSIDGILRCFGLDRTSLGDQDAVLARVRALAAQMPTYITLKEVKKRWGNGQEDVFPVVQFEKLWGDMTALPAARCAYIAVPRWRGQQLKEQAQLDGWLRDGSCAGIEALSGF